MYYKDRVRNQGILERKPVIKVTSKSIEFILELLANGWGIEQILKNQEKFTREDMMTIGGFSEKDKMVWVIKE